MQLQLKNIGMIKEANVKIDGLTVIAGENDTGKSTLSKALYFIVTFLSDVDKVKKNFREGKLSPKNESKRASRLSKLIFDNQLNNNSSFIVETDSKKYQFGVKNNSVTNDDFDAIQIDKNELNQPIMIETPIEDKNKLQEIYEKLSEPFDEFDKMDSDILNG